MPLAEARLLAMEEDSSRVLDLKFFGSRGGCIVVSGDGGLVDSCLCGTADDVAVSPSPIDDVVGTSLTTGFSCAILNN